MTFLPIVERELRVTARNSATYAVRMFTPVAVAVFGIIRLLLTPRPGPRALTGADMFATLSSLALLFCVLEGVRKTADCLSGEKREGTLGLLFLTDLKGYDVILGKLAAASLTSLYALFAILPILAWSLFLGGVTFGEIWRVGLASTSVLVFSLSAGIWISARSYSASRAMAGTFFVVLLFLFVPFPMIASPLAPLSPARAFFASSDAVYRIYPREFWISLLLSVVFSWSFLARASAIINRFCEEGASDGPTPSAQAGVSMSNSGDRSSHAKALEDNPMFWLANRGRNPAMLIWLLALIAAIFITSSLCVLHHYNAASLNYVVQQQASPFVRPPIAPTWVSDLSLLLVVFVAIMNSLVKVLLASQACRCLAEARRSAALELLLCTPLKVADILEGQILALRRIFLRPALVLLVFEMGGLFWLLQNNMGPKDLVVSGVVIAETAFAIFFFVDLQAVAWVAMWFGLCSKTESRAMFKTTFLTILLPHVLLVLYCLGWALFVFWPIGTLIWARLQLQDNFRVLAGYRSSSSGEPSAWMAYEIPTPPKQEPMGVVQGQ